MHKVRKAAGKIFSGHGQMSTTSSHHSFFTSSFLSIHLHGLHNISCVCREEKKFTFLPLVSLWLSYVAYTYFCTRSLNAYVYRESSRLFLSRFFSPKNTCGSGKGRKNTGIGDFEKCLVYSYKQHPHWDAFY